MGTVIVGILALFLLIGPFQSPITNGIHGWRTEDTTESFLSVTTPAGVTAANVTLTYDLFQAVAGEVISITSNVTDVTENPLATSYTESTKVLLVSGLDDDNKRTLTVNYYAETKDTVMRVLGPFLSVLIFGGCAFAILYSIWRTIGHKGRGR